MSKQPLVELDRDDPIVVTGLKKGKMILISIPHEGGGQAVYMGIPQARLLRDWLNGMLP